MKTRIFLPTENISRTETRDKNHCVYIDNYIVSVFLMQDLKDVGINASGMINIDRKHLPKFKETKHMTRGESEWFINDEGVCAIKWIDNKAVHLVSNFHDPSENHCEKEEATRRKSDQC